MSPVKLTVVATPEQVTVAQNRIRRVPAYPKLCEHFPQFKTIVDGLPDIDSLWRLPHELRAPILDALKYAGVDVPADAWKLAGVSP